MYSLDFHVLKKKAQRWRTESTSSLHSQELETTSDGRRESNVSSFARFAAQSNYNMVVLFLFPVHPKMTRVCVTVGHDWMR